MNQLQFPLDLTFKIGTLSNDFVTKDANGETVAYVRQKMMKLIDEVQVFSNEDRAEIFILSRLINGLIFRLPILLPIAWAEMLVVWRVRVGLRCGKQITIYLMNRKSRCCLCAK